MIESAVVPNLTEWAKEAGITSEEMKKEIIAYATTIGAIAIESPANKDKLNAVAFRSKYGKYEYKLTVERTLVKVPKGKKIDS